ncbi:MAG: energy transducer TonB [Candidatus Omnitrophota bacterium]
MQLIPIGLSAQSADGADCHEGDFFAIKDGVQAFQIISSEASGSYSNYYKLIREKIVHKVEYNYKDYYRNGDVSLFFTLKLDGSLDRIDVDIDKSTKDRRLIDVAIKSLQQASPFPPFPKELNVPKASFDLTISFKKQ